MEKQNQRDTQNQMWSETQPSSCGSSVRDDEVEQQVLQELENLAIQPQQAAAPGVDHQNEKKLDKGDRQARSERRQQRRHQRGNRTTPQPTDSNLPTTAAESERELEPLVEIRETPNKGGVGLFALRKIPAGTKVLAEVPLISLSPAEEDDPAAIEREFQSLSRSKQKSYLALFNAEKSRMTKVVSIYYSNCYNSDDNSGATLSKRSDRDCKGRGGSCIGVLASRINHSCIPNVQFSYSTSIATTSSSSGEKKKKKKKKGLMVFHALKPISRNKEILSNYEPSVFALSRTRQRNLQLHYGFACACEACVPLTEFWMKSDERRRAMVGIRNEIQRTEVDHLHMHQEKGDRYADLMPALLRLESLLIKEGLLGSVLADTYGQMATWAERKGDVAAARKWRGREREVGMGCFGKDSERVKGEIEL